MTILLRFSFSKVMYSKVMHSRPMLSRPLTKGFSLVEILVSLIIVSLVAVNITGLQKKIAEQQRDNISHAKVITLVTKKMEKVLSFESSEALMAMHGTSETLTDDTIGELVIDWQVTEVDNIVGLDEMATLVDDFKQITLTISWFNIAAETQSFTYSSNINIGRLLSTASTVEETTEIEQMSSIIVSALNNNEVIYFEPNMGYQEGSFVIFDSYLYQAKKAYTAGDAYPHSASDPESGAMEIAEGWQSVGSIDDPELNDINDLITRF